MQRYAGKPFLRLLECYVLSAIGQLSSEDQGRLVAMTPKLQSLYTRQGSWSDIVAAEMGFPSNMTETIKKCWTENRKRAEENGEDLLPDHFAQIFVDENLGVQ